MNPDFSGEYVLNREASTLSAAAAEGIQSARLRIEHREPNFSCEFKFFFVDGTTFEGTFKLATDGREVTQTERGCLAVSKLNWDGGALLFTSRGEGTSTFRYEFDARRRLQVTEQLRGTDHDQENLWIFERSENT